MFSTSGFKQYLGYTNQNENSDVFYKCYPTANAAGPGTRGPGTFIAPARALLQKAFTFEPATTQKKTTASTQKKRRVRAARRVALQKTLAKIHLAALGLPKTKLKVATPANPKLPWPWVDPSYSCLHGMQGGRRRGAGLHPITPECMMTR